jgi:hypothetical protein
MVLIAASCFLLVAPFDQQKAMQVNALSANTEQMLNNPH